MTYFVRMNHQLSSSSTKFSGVGLGCSSFVFLFIFTVLWDFLSDTAGNEFGLLSVGRIFDLEYADGTGMLILQHDFNYLRIDVSRYGVFYTCEVKVTYLR